MHCMWCNGVWRMAHKLRNKSHHNFKSNVKPSIQIFISIFTMPNKVECHTHTHWWHDDLPIWHISFASRSSDCNIPVEYQNVYIVSNQFSVIEICWMKMNCTACESMCMLNTVNRITKSICFIIVKSEDRRPPLKRVLTVDRQHIVV